MGIRHLILVLLLTQLSPSDRVAVDRYRSAIQSAESAASRLAIEPAFSAARALREALIPKLESLGDEEFKNLQQLRGLLINREEVVFIKPDVDYFTKLAAARGVQQELEQFLRRFSESSARVRIDQRLQSLRNGRSDIRPNCTSG